MLSYAEHEDKRILLELNVAKLAAELLQSSDVKNILLHEMSNMTLPLSNTKAKFGSLTSSTIMEFLFACSYIFSCKTSKLVFVKLCFSHGSFLVYF